MPQPDSERPPSSRRRSALTLFGALLLCSVGAVVLLVLPTGFIGPVMVFGGLLFFGVIGFHYFVWGRWLGAVLRQEMEQDAEEGQGDRVG